jgi:predicted HD superfamily hydrolase involved in NAD metabolism
MYTAGCLAMAHGYDIQKAMLAGLLHDCAKCISTSKKIELCQKHQLPISEVELENPGLLHAKAGMVLASEKYEINDPEILHAIRVHTTGAPNMNLLDKIIFVADYIEPQRDQAPRLDVIRKLAFDDLDRCVAEILYDTLHYLNGRKGSIDPATQQTYEFYGMIQNPNCYEKQ